MNRISMTAAAKTFFRTGRSITDPQRHLLMIIHREGDEIIPIQFRMGSSSVDEGVLCAFGSFSMPAGHDDMVTLEHKGLIELHMTWTNEGSGWGPVFLTEKGLGMAKRCVQA